MFAKLLKYEWKASAGLLGILSLCALGVGAAGAVVVRLFQNSLESEDVRVSTIFGFLLAMLYLALIVYAAGSEIFLLYRFYKNKFSDEGYLTFTLPVRSWQIFLASFVNNLAWMAIIALVVVTAIGIVVFSLSLGDASVMEELGYLFDEIRNGELRSLYSGQALSTLVSFVSGVCLIMSCITIGSVIAKKHKILASIGLYYGISMVMGMITTVAMAMVMFSAVASDVDAIDTAFNSMYLIQSAVYGLTAIGGYFLSVYLMDKKLNLP